MANTLKNWFNNFKRDADWLLFAVVVGISLFGLLMIYSSSFIFAQERAGSGFFFLKRQAIYFIVGMFGLFMMWRMELQFWKQKAFWIFGLCLGLLIAVWIPGLGVKAGGAQRWINLGWMSFQPAELAKFVIVLLVAKQLEKKKNRLHEFKSGIVAPVLLIIPILALVLTQPDFGTFALCGVTVLAMMFLAGVSKKNLLVVGTVALSMVAGLIAAAPYRLARLSAFLDPWKDPEGKGFQVIQSMTGFFQGGVFGRGLGNGKEKLFYLPEAHNDFIFSVIGEELGFIGVVGLVSVFALFIYRGFRVAEHAKDVERNTFAFLLASGITLMLGIQAFLNMFVAMGLLPTKGMNLPFVSYGGSSLVVDLMAVGVLLSISRRTRDEPRKQASAV